MSGPRCHAVHIVKHKAPASPGPFNLTIMENKNKRTPEEIAEIKRKRVERIKKWYERWSQQQAARLESVYTP